MSRNDSNVVEGATKLCHIVKRPDFEGYGFNLHSEKIKPGQYIGKVDANSPAEAAGLKEGDRIIEVNGVPIGSETHKQVVQRIKAIACEVRLLLIDVDNKNVDNVEATAAAALATTKIPKTPTTNGTASATTTNGNGEYQGTKQEMPGASANISSISMVSTKRSSNASNQDESNNNLNSQQQQVNDINSMDVTDNFLINTTMPIKKNSITDASLNGTKHLGNNNMTSITTTAAEAIATPILTTPPPPSAGIAIVPQFQSQQHRTSSTSYTTTPTAAVATTTTNSLNRAGSLQLPMTAAEMRAKLLSKKKYDPKNESVDLKKKFDIIQKL